MDYKTPLSDEADVPKGPDVDEPIIWGRKILFIFLAVFVIWSVFFPLEKAAVAPGTIVVDTERREIQHLEGGVIEKILVEDGQHVVKGDPLVILNKIQANAKENSTALQYVELLAIVSRLVAERDNKETLVFPEVLMNNLQKEKVADTIKTQESIFNDNKTRVEKTVTSLKEKIVHLNTQIGNLGEQIKSEEARVKYAKKEVKAARAILKKKYVSKADVWRLEQQALLAESAVNEHKAEMAAASQQLTQTELQITTVYTDRRKEILAELQKAQEELAQAKEAYDAAKDVLYRTVIRAPISGTVMNKQNFSEGGVIQNGVLIMEVVPDNDALVIESHVNPRDIDMVHLGMLAKVQLTAYLARRTPMVKGTVTRVAADAVQDPKTGEYYYDIRVTIDQGQLKHLKHVKLYPGMPAQVSLIVERRSLWDYVITPITSSFDRAFIEE